MTNIQAQILRLFQTLPSEERQDLAEHLYHNSRQTTFYETMTTAQRVHLHDAIARADRNEPAELVSVVFGRLRKELPIIAA